MNSARFRTHYAPRDSMASGLDSPSQGVLPESSEPSAEVADGTEAGFDATVAPGFVPGSTSQELFYYQPVYWKESCVTCHVAEGGTFVPKSQEPRPELRGPLRVIKVTIPGEEAQIAITKSRAILLSTAIVTVFLSVITLYLVVRYVIVKPLNHLRYVSDEISRGNTTLRADIQTNDEFEDLAASFNRMLRHLIDTQEELRRVNAIWTGNSISWRRPTCNYTK